APKILRGQPFGKIGRRRDHCISPGRRRDLGEGACVRISSALMAVPVDPSGGAGPGPSANGGDRLGPLDAAGVCPYLISADGAWRSLRPHRDHRCGALSPAMVVAPEKQRALCLVDAHDSCATYKAARARARGTRAGERAPQPLWPVARTAPVVIEP